MKHAERCDRTTYCGLAIWSSKSGMAPPPRGITTNDCFTDDPNYRSKLLPEDLCRKCRAGLTDGKPWVPTQKPNYGGRDGQKT